MLCLSIRNIIGHTPFYAAPKQARKRSIPRLLRKLLSRSNGEGRLYLARKYLEKRGKMMISFDLAKYPGGTEIRILITPLGKEIIRAGVLVAGLLLFLIICSI